MSVVTSALVYNVIHHSVTYPQTTDEYDVGADYDIISGWK